MKVKAFHFYSCHDEEVVESQINGFIENKTVIDIKQTSTLELDRYDGGGLDRFTQVLIMYKEELE